MPYYIPPSRSGASFNISYVVATLMIVAGFEEYPHKDRTAAFSWDFVPPILLRIERTALLAASRISDQASSAIITATRNAKLLKS